MSRLVYLPTIRKIVDIDNMAMVEEDSAVDLDKMIEKLEKKESIDSAPSTNLIIHLRIPAERILKIQGETVEGFWNTIQKTTKENGK